MKSLVKALLRRCFRFHGVRNAVINVLAREGWVAGIRTSPLGSETARRRAVLSPFCKGDGADLGFGGDAINETALRVDLPQPYATGVQPTQLTGDAADLRWFKDGVLDYVYSSHLLEDFQDTRAVLREWLRVIRPGGHLVILCPDETRYRMHCDTTGHPYNSHHVHADFSLAKVKGHLAELGQTQVVHEDNNAGDYGWEIVVKVR